MLFVGLTMLSFSSSKEKEGGLVNSISKFKSGVETAQPRQTITLADGTWNDVELKFMGNGTTDTWVAIYDKNNLILGNANPDLFYLL